MGTGRRYIKGNKKHNSRILNIKPRQYGQKTIGTLYDILEDCTRCTLSCMKITESFVKIPFT